MIGTRFPYIDEAQREQAFGLFENATRTTRYHEHT